MTDPEVTVTRRAMEPPPAYTLWWPETEQCSSRSGDFGRVSWYETAFFADGVFTKLGEWNSRREITIVTSAIMDRQVVRHEILHDLLGGDGDHEDRSWALCGLPRGTG